MELNGRQQPARNKNREKLWTEMSPPVRNCQLSGFKELETCRHRADSVVRLPMPLRMLLPTMTEFPPERDRVAADPANRTLAQTVSELSYGSRSRYPSGIYFGSVHSTWNVFSSLNSPYRFEMKF